MSLLAQLFNKNGDKIDPINKNYEKQLENHNDRIETLEQNKDVYSFREVKTNKVYIDENGKEWSIYRKILKYTKNADTNWENISLSSIGITNNDYIYFADGSRILQQDTYVKDIANDFNIYINTSANILSFAPTTTKMVFTLVLEYTKTTDS